jgi:CheY-like chemotaxis protein
MIMTSAITPAVSSGKRVGPKRERTVVPVLARRGRGKPSSIRPSNPLVRLVAEDRPTVQTGNKVAKRIIRPPIIAATILLVEDCADDAFFMQRALKAAGLKSPLQVVQHGQMALDYLAGTGNYADRDKYPFPSLVLLDLKLPYVLGLDVLKWIRSRNHLQLLPVVVLTASGERSDLERAYRAGANSFMVKPSADDLDAFARCIVDYWFTHSLLPSVE